MNILTRRGKKTVAEATSGPVWHKNSNEPYNIVMEQYDDVSVGV